MTVAIGDRSVPRTGGRARRTHTTGGAPARHAVARWAWRLFKREWHRQALILILLMVAIAATDIGLGVASNASNLKADPSFGTANTIINLDGSDPALAADISAIQSRFGPVDVIAHQTVPIPGSVSSVDIRSENPYGPFDHVTVRLDHGHYPTGPGEVAVSGDVAQTLGLHVGSLWSAGSRSLRVVGIVENPLNLDDQFALVAPGGASPPGRVDLLLNTTTGSVQGFRLPSGSGLGMEQRGAGNQLQGETVILVLGTLGLIFVGLMAVAGFTVMAHRRMRALGMLGSLGASDRHIRIVMLVNGAAVGATAAILGTAVGLAGWLAFVPTLQSLAGHRIDRFSLPWWAIAAAMVLTVATAVLSAWWPARAMARLPVVAALSGRPPRPQPAHRFAALGGALLAGGLVLLSFADQRRVAFIIGGTVATVVGLLFLAPLAIRALATLASRTTVSVRLALRDLARYQARSGAALGAVTLAIGIAATIALSAAAAETPTSAGNLPADQLLFRTTQVGNDGGTGPIPPLTSDQLQSATTQVDKLATALHASSVLPLDEAYDPRSPLEQAQPGSPAGYQTASLAQITTNGPGEQINAVRTLYVATPAVLDHYGIPATKEDRPADVVAYDSHLDGLQIFTPRNSPGPAAVASHPNIQVLPQLPRYSSDPGALITVRTMQELGLQAIPAGWLIQTAHPLTAAQISAARAAAAATGLYVETRHAQKTLAPLRNWSTAAGVLLALGVLSITVGLIRSETANDLRTLTATGAAARTRRGLTGATAGALALLGSLLGTAGAYAALLVWHRSDLSPLGRIPVANLLFILIGLPGLAVIGGWLLAGREPPVIARQPLE
jgi:putative ABC transport system permease protein